MNRAEDILNVADSVFTRLERSAMARLPLVDQRRRAVELWTYKESYMKARGLGMSIPPDAFQIDYASGAPVLDLRELGGDDGARWELSMREINEHLVASCIERKDLGGCAVTARRALLESKE
jgi:4'-phosphopantetheinyl transferase